MELIKTSKPEAELLTELLAGHTAALEVSLPDDLNPKRAVQWGRAAASIHDKTDGLKAVSIQVMGRIHYLARINPAILEEAGCATIQEFEDTVLHCRDHRSTVWKFSAAFKAFPELTPAEAAEMGTTNMKRATQIAQDTGASPSQRKRLVQKAKELPAGEFKSWVENDSGLSAPGATGSDVFPLYGTAEQIGELKELLAMRRFKLFTESDIPIAMILAAIWNSKCDWPMGDDEDLQPEPLRKIAEDW